MIAPEPRHPLAYLTANPEWAAVERRRHALRVAERQRREEQPASGLRLGVMGGVMAAVALAVLLAGWVL